MNYVLNSAQMKAIDRYSIETIGIPSCVLMERAALAVVHHTKQLCSYGDKILAVCGYGNNGGDGIAAARILHIEGYSVALFMVGEKERATEETKRQLKIAEKIGIPMIRKVNWSEYTIIIDAIFGIGLTRPVQGEFQKVIEQINQAEKTVISVDIPSGVCADNGKILGIAVKANCTVTFGYQKIGCLLFPGAEAAGTVFVEDIGFAKADWISPPTCFYMEQTTNIFSLSMQEPFCGELLPKRTQNSNKGTYGKVLVIAGSKNMSGAAYFAATAAYRMGAGLVRILTAKENREILQQQLPEAVLTTYTTNEEGLLQKDKEQLKEAMLWASAIVLGPGLGKSKSSVAIVQKVIRECSVPLVVDADGLNILSEIVTETVSKTGSTKERMDCLAQLLPPNTILTPHKKELARLTGILFQELAECLLESSMPCTLGNSLIFVKKDARTIVSFGDSDYINCSGNNGMATAGSGDVLAGMIGGLLAQGQLPKLAAVAGCYLHGLAGDVAAKQKGVYSLLASDILEAIPNILKE